MRREIADASLLKSPCKCRERGGLRVKSTVLHSRGFVPNGFIRKKLYRRLDSSGLLEVHADGGLGDLQVGQTAKVLKGQRDRSEYSAPDIHEKTVDFSGGVGTV